MDLTDLVARIHPVVKEIPLWSDQTLKELSNITHLCNIDIALNDIRSIFILFTER
jgi:hypothetical protein